MQKEWEQGWESNHSNEVFIYKYCYLFIKKVL